MKKSDSRQLMLNLGGGKHDNSTVISTMSTAHLTSVKMSMKIYLKNK